MAQYYPAQENALNIKAQYYNTLDIEGFSQMMKDLSYWNFSYFCRHVIANNLNFIGNLR